MDFAHVPVLPEQCMRLLNIQERPQGLFVDGTLGGGGHTELILQRTQARVIGIDRDADAIAAASKRLQPYGERFQAVKGNYVDMPQILMRTGVRAADGVLLDLGVSSYQLDTPERGFSFHNDAPLDMRMDQSASLTAKDVVNGYSEEELARILFEYGEERWAKRIAQFIVRSRPLSTTMDLVRVIDQAVPKAVRREVSHPARRSFQALRIEVNGELADLQRALENACSCLADGGRLVVISFHSLEDRIVKQTFQRMQNPCTCPPKTPVCVCGKKPLGVVITRHPEVAEKEETDANIRSRSAKVRAFERRLE